jgi:hypothetical protein
LHWPIGIPALWPLNVGSFGGEAYAYQPVAPFITTAGDVITYRYTEQSLFLSGGPSSLPVSPAIPEPATILMFAAGLAVFSGRAKRRCA